MNIKNLFKSKTQRISDYYNSPVSQALHLWCARQTEADMIELNAATILAGILSAVHPFDLTENALENAIESSWKSAMRLNKLKQDYLSCRK